MNTVLAKVLATWFGAGLFPKAPGTFGSLIAAALAWEIARQGGWGALVLATALVTAIGIPVCAAYAQTTGKEDAPEVVIDEVAGQWLALIPAALHPALFTPLALLTGFAFFRAFDILKPGPIGWADRHVKGGLGVMLDDILAGAAAAICLWIALPHLPILA